ncbi:hypothetical protein [Leadbetterella byssophila]|uniref:Uncharacterized protein n=1 Tax=Leadbetterella byssophila (strain DSM 17132 / JCM 16389 / KACC 11308 / NBRC 106382 / 4M15) TaxID=649349 RepID=E4RZH6_LEAB4|nr:hypothetical protein [Leadbetterella byssophila]ADQ17400.1 hypothetical protein Lbys_1693 [Leadbetterella byssophila DSM 17132]
MSKISSHVPSWAMLVIYLLCLVILAVFGDLFTFIVGTFILSIVFRNGYNRTHLEDH